MIISKFFEKLEQLLFCNRIALLWVGYAIAAFALLRDYDESITRAFDIWNPSYYAIGDMLINYAGGLVRRGLSGQVAIVFSQWFGGPPWIWAWFLLVAITGIFLLLATRLIKRLPENSETMPLILAPWGVLYFAYDNVSSFRKEIIGYLALTMILQAAISGSRRTAQVWATAGVIIFVVGMFAHEVIVFLLPALMLAIYLIARLWPEDQMWFAALATASMVLGIAIFLFFTIRHSPDVDLLCIAAQFPCNIIPDGTNPFFLFVNNGLLYALEGSAIYGYWPEGIIIYCSIGLLAGLPFLGFCISDFGPARHWGAILVPIICMIPLFIFAADWGRWIQLIFLPLSLVGIAALIAGVAEYRRFLPPWFAVVYVSTWSISHFLPEYHFNAWHLLPALGMVIAGSYGFRCIETAWAKIRSRNLKLGG